MISGWIILDKPSGMTSRAAGGRVARMFGVKKFGHLGTLDPMASGVLPIALGEATKMIPYLDLDVSLLGLPQARTRNPESVEALAKADGKDRGVEEVSQKEYLFSIVWGIQTDTDDITGKITKEIPHSTLHTPHSEQIAAACEQLVGEIEQTPPAYSAVHVNGRRAYELARAGKPVDIPPRKVKIYGLEYNAPIFRVCCSAGTYVRSLARGIAEKCGTIATVDMIRRIRTHGFEIKDAVSLDFLENLYNNNPADAQKHLRPVDFGLDDILVTELNDDDANLFKSGGFINWNDGREQGTVDLRRVCHKGEFIGIGVLENKVLKPKRIINN